MDAALLRVVALGLSVASGAVGCTKDAQDGAGGSPGVACEPQPGEPADAVKCSEAGASACTVPPAAPGVASVSGGTHTTIAVTRLDFGDTDATGKHSETAWKQLGYNLDGLVSHRCDPSHCRLARGANPRNVKADGNGGVDNSFGGNLLPLMTSIDSSTPASANQRIADGHFTLMIDLQNLRDPALAPDQTGIDAALLTGADKGSPPAFDGTDVWPVSADSVVGNDVAAPRQRFAGSYVGGATWVSTGDVTVVIPIPFDQYGYTMMLPIEHAVITMRVSGTGPSAVATDGVIAGVLRRDVVVELGRQVGGAMNPSYCEGSTFSAVAVQVAQSGDIRSDVTNGDPSLDCDAISIGLGFEGRAVQVGPVVPAATAEADPCPGDAGTGDAGG